MHMLSVKERQIAVSVCVVSEEHNNLVPWYSGDVTQRELCPSCNLLVSFVLNITGDG